MKNLTLWLLVFLCISLDFTTTAIGVGLMGFDEKNVIVNFLYKNNDYLWILKYSFIIVPSVIYTFNNMLGKFLMRNLFLKLILIIYTVVLSSNFMSILGF